MDAIDLGAGMMVANSGGAISIMDAGNDQTLRRKRHNNIWK
jgi:hypothetical protein